MVFYEVLYLCHISKRSGEIFYIGKGSGNRHIITQNRGDAWEEIVDLDGYTSVILSYWESEAEAFEHEKFLIGCLREIGINLVNKHQGGSFHKGLVPSRGVYCKSHNLYFESCTEAARWAASLGYKQFDRSRVSRMCREGKPSKGFVFLYADGTPPKPTPLKKRKVPVRTTNTGEPHIHWHTTRKHFSVYFGRLKINKDFSPKLYGGVQKAFDAAIKYKYSLYDSIYNDIPNKEDHFPYKKLIKPLNEAEQEGLLVL